jgi:hypothetical protein
LEENTMRRQELSFKFDFVPNGQPQVPEAMRNIEQVAHAKKWAESLWANFCERYHPRDLALAVFREVGLQLGAQARAIVEGHATVEKIVALQAAWNDQVIKVMSEQTQPPVMSGGSGQ